MDYWNDAVTEKSWEILGKLKGFNYVIIGGWAAYLWTRTHKSKDIDIVLEDYEGIMYLKKNFDLNKDNNLKKYEIKIDEIDIDIYVPFFSKLAIPPEDIIKFSTKIQNFSVVKPEVLLILKQGAEEDREYSVKGEKDRIDIMTLLIHTSIDSEEYFKLLEKYELQRFSGRLKKIITGFKEIKYLNLNPREMKLKKKELLENIWK